MGGARTIWRLGGAAACFALLLGCRQRSKQPPREQPPQAALSATSTERAPRALPKLAPPIAEALEEVHDQKAVISPPRDETPRLAFGKGHLAQVMDDKVVFRDTKEGAVIAESTLGLVHAVTAGADGSLIALGLSGGTRLEARSAKPHGFAHVAFFPGAALFPDLEEPSNFYVYYAGEQQLFRYAFEAEAGSFLPIEDRLPLVGCVGAPALARDGAFLCATADGIERRAPRGREARFKLPAGVPTAVRILPAQRLDELFWVSRAGEVVHLRLEPQLPVLGRFQLPAAPFAAVSNEEVLAFVLIDPPAPGSGRRFTLLVTDQDGRERFKADLGNKGAPPDDDWLKAVIGDKNLAISRFEPLLAVGGPSRVTVWDYALGRLIFSH